MENKSSSYLYVVFSNTPCKMGSFIRSVTHGEFNHVSIALDENLSELYSFARLKHNTPLCGGFVREGAERFRFSSNVAKISVCKIFVGQENVAKAREKIESMKMHSGDYVYNMLSAILVPWHKRITVKNSFTCVEFVSSILKIAGINLPRTYSASELYKLIWEYEIYRGEFPKNASIVDTTYIQPVPITLNLYRSFMQLGRLFVRLVWN